MTLFDKANSISGQLVDLALKTYSEGSIPASIKTLAKQVILDQLGLQIAGTEFDTTKQARQVHVILNESHGKSTTTRFGDKVSALAATFVNGSAAHAQDFDDSHQEAQTHPGSVVIPAAIAVGEQMNANGKNILNAIIIGMEIMLRLAHSLCPACIQGGHHTPPTIGPFGAAIAAGLLLHLNKQQLINALGIAGSYSGGLVTYTVSGGSVKRIHTALGARAGVEAALLAQAGMTAPADIIENKKGMWAVYGRENAFPDRLLSEIGNVYLLERIMIKPYNCCYLINPAIESFLALCKKEGLSADHIKQVNVGMSQFSKSHAGTIVIPKDTTGAQFSTSFTLALSLLREPPNMWSYENAADILNDKTIIHLAEKISVFEDEIVNSAFPKQNGCSLRIETLSGDIFETRITDPKGSPNNPFTNDDILKKFNSNLAPICTPEQIAEIHQTILAFESLSDIHELQDCITANTRNENISVLAH